MRGVKRQQPAEVRRAIRDYNCSKIFNWTVDQTDHTPAGRLNRMLVVHDAIETEQERVRKERENRAKSARRRAGKGKRRR